MTSRLGSAAALAATCVLMLPALARADVTVDCDGLQNAMDTQPAGATITLEAGELCDGTYFVPDGSDLKLQGEEVDEGEVGSGFQSDNGNRSLTTEPSSCRAACRRAPGTDTGTLTLDTIVFEGTPTADGRAGSDAAQREGDNPGGGMYWQGDDLTLSNTVFENVDTAGSGGALFVENKDGNGFPYGAVTLTNVTFSDNTAGRGAGFSPGSGGGARIIAGTVTVTDSTFEDNFAPGNGGGLALTIGRGEEINNRGPLPADVQGEISRTTFDGNEAATDGYGCDDAGGGGVYVEDRNGGTIDPDPEDRAVVPGSARLAVGDNTYTDNEVGSQESSECDNGRFVGGGAEFRGIEVLGYTTETYRENAAYADEGEAEGGGFAVTASEFGPGSYTGENTVMIGNEAQATGLTPGRAAADRDPGDPAGNGGAAYAGGGANGNEIALVHPTIVFNRAIVDEFGDAMGGAIAADTNDVVSVDRAIVFGNTVNGVDALQIDGTSNVSVTNSDDPDACRPIRRAPDADGNICDTPAFEGGDGGAPVQAANSVTVNAVDPDPAVTDDFLHEGRPSPVGGKSDMGAHELQFAVVPTPSPSPVPSASPSPAPGPSASPSPAPSASPKPVVTASPSPTPDVSDVQDDTGSGRKSCAGRRYFPIVLRRIGYTFVKAKIKVNGKRVKTIRYKSGRLGARIDLRKFPRRTIRIKIVATTTTGQKVRGKRIYHPCYRGRRPHTIPELLIRTLSTG